MNVILRRRPPPEESIPKERSKRGFLSRRARSNLSEKLEIIRLKQPVPERKVGEYESERGEHNDRDPPHDSLSVMEDKGKQRNDSPADTQSPPSYDRTLLTYLDSKDSRGFWERLMQDRGKNLTFGFLHSSTPPANAPQPILRNLRHCNSSPFPVGCPVYVAACREEDRYGITPESDAEADAAMLRTNADAANISMPPGQPAVVVQVTQVRPTQIQASTSGPEEIGITCCGFIISCRRRSNLHQP